MGGGRYKAPGIPVVLTGFAAAHPAMARWGFGRLASRCGGRPVGFVQRRASVLQDLRGALASLPPLVARIFDRFLEMRFGVNATEAPLTWSH